MKKSFSIVLAILMIMSMSVVAFAADGNVAKIGENEFATLAQAISASTAGDTITLLDDVTEDITISRNIILDGADKTYTGKITLNKVTATIQNVNFVNGQIYKNKKTGTAGTITVKDCTFNGAIAENQYAINIGAANNIIIENCDAKDVGFGFFYAPSTTNVISIKNVNIDGASYGIHIVYNNTSTIENVTMKNVAYGVMNQTYGAKTITFKNCVIDATKAPVAIWERAVKEQEFIFKGENDFGTDDLTFGSSLVKVVKDVAAIGEETFSTINEAIAAANDGDIIKVIDDHTLANDDVCEKVSGMYPYIAVTDKKVTIDLNGKTIKVNPSLDADMLAVFYAGGTGELTVKDSSEAQSGAVDVVMAEGTDAYSMFTALGTGSKMYIESGSYTIDKVDYGQSMIYAGQNNQVFVSGGNFVLGNAKSRDPGNGEMQPWMFNAHGDGMKFILVTGGTYNTDPTHYHGEASFPGCNKVVDNGNGTYTVKIVHTPGAEASCQAAQTCVDCGAELDAIKACTFETYVSDENATCTEDGTKTAQCIYGCGATDTVADEGSAKGHTAGSPANCQSAQTCDICGAELDAIKDHEYGEYVSDDNATCQKDGTKTAECVYGCGETDTITDKGTKKDHNDSNGNGECDYCSGEFCSSCGRLHDDLISSFICLLMDFIKLATSFIKAVF